MTQEIYKNRVEQFDAFFTLQIKLDSAGLEKYKEQDWVIFWPACKPLGTSEILTGSSLHQTYLWTNIDHLTRDHRLLHDTLLLFSFLMTCANFVDHLFD